MAQILKKTESNGKLTIISVIGKVTCDEIIDTLNKLYSNTFTVNWLWDFSKADFKSSTSEQIRQILDVAMSYAHLRRGGKSAIVVASDLGYGLGRMYGTLSEISKNPINYSIFKSKDEAMAWLTQKGTEIMESST